MEPGPVIHTVGSSVLEGKRSEKACCAWRVAGRGWAKLGPWVSGAASARGLTLVPPNVTMWLLSHRPRAGGLLLATPALCRTLLATCHPTTSV